MIFLIVGLVLFLGSHVLTTRRAARADLRARFGANRYKRAYSIIALLGFALICYGFADYRADGYTRIWTPPKALTPIAMLMMLPTFVLLAATNSGGLIQGKIKHPMLSGIQIWALAHLLTNGDLGSMVLFGSFLAWAIYARIAIEQREADEGAPDWAAMRFGRKDTIAILAGFSLYGLFGFVLHPILIGVSIMD